jgi:hypothetical protein
MFGKYNPIVEVMINGLPVMQAISESKYNNVIYNNII